MRYVVTGGAGHIGSTIVRHLLADSATTGVTVFDNFSTGKRSHLTDLRDSRLHIIEDDAESQTALSRAFKGHDVVIHLAANAEIQRATTDPDLDYRQGTALTRNVLEAMRVTGVRQILFASGGGVYGDWHGEVCTEDHPVRPIAPYGAAKVAGEAMLTAYAHLFGICAFAFRICNVTGPRLTHGIVHDFLVKLRRDPSRLTILGNGTQRKSYIHVDDVARGMLYVLPSSLGGRLGVFNLTSTEMVTVDEIADLAMEVLALPSLVITRGKENRGWAGDVPVVRLSGAKLAALGWKPSMESRAALRAAFEANR